MRVMRIGPGALLAAGLMLAGTAAVAVCGDRATTAADAQRPADNTGRNVRDRSGKTLTAQDQSNSKADVELTRRIRRAIVADDSLSTKAHNVKIITTKGGVTLRGPVASEEERASVAAKAKEVAGARKVDNQLEIARH